MTGHPMPASASAQDVATQLVGTWKLTSWVLRVIGGELTEPYGPNPNGRIVMTPEGHWSCIITAANRQAGTTPEEKAALMDTMLAYFGKYTIDGDRITVDVEMSSNEIYVGPLQKQTRFFTLDGDKLVLRTPEIMSAVKPGQKVAGILNWERQR
jgi:hypothetical protein